MNGDTNGLVAKLWSYCHVLRDDGLSYQDYLEQLTFLLFLKMADERVALLDGPHPVPKGYRCISSIGLGESQRAMLEYYEDIVTLREELPQPKRDCELLLTQGTAAQEQAVGSGWKKIWEGARPGDNKERFRLYRRVPPKKV